MSKKLLLASFTTIAVSVLLVAPASADCVEEIKKAKKERQSANLDGPVADAVDRIIAKAEQAAKEGKERRCKRMVSRARSKL